MIDGDEDRLLQVLGNLLDNAIRFSPRGGEIVLRFEDAVSAGQLGKGKIKMVVIDQGPGIDSESLPNIFQRYWQAQGSCHSGAGLGLPISIGIVRAHGGDIAVFSEPGQGARFEVSLPWSG